MSLQPPTGTREEDRCARFETINGIQLYPKDPHRTMKWLGVALALCVLIPGAHCASNAIEWCYHLPQCNDATWPTIAAPHCNGTRQSPINIITGSATIDPNLTAFSFTNWNKTSAMLTIENTGRTVKVTIMDNVKVSGGNLPETYDTLQFHLHWGNGTTGLGSEHTVDGKRYPMEIHFVHTKSSLNKNTTLALADPKGAAALGFFIEVSDSDTPETNAWNNITSYLASIPNKGDKVNIAPGFSLDDLLGSVNRSSYYRYYGSLTTPLCNEAVIWTVFKESLKVPKSVIDSFSTTLYVTNSSSVLMHNVYRRIQADLPVTTQEASTSASSQTCYSLGLMALSLVFGRM